MLTAVLNSYPARFLFLFAAIAAAVTIIGLRVAMGKARARLTPNQTCLTDQQS